MTKEEYKKALEERRIFVVGSKYTRNGWTEFRVYEIKDNKIETVWVHSPYQNKKTGTYKCTAWGTSRVLEITLSIGYALGLKFDEMRPQVSSTIN